MKIQIINTPTSLSDIESEIIEVSEMLRKGWLLIGEKLLTVEKNQLYKQQDYKTFTAWLKYLSKTLELKPSTLWKYLKIVRMIDDINLPFSDVNLKNVTGLEQIARIYEHTNNADETIKLIQQLDEKVINTTEIKKISSELINPKPISFLKIYWRNIIKCFLASMPSKPMLKVLPVLFAVFYINDIS